MSGYILLAMRFEERDLVQHIGEPYERYRQQVPALVPQPGDASLVSHALCRMRRPCGETDRGTPSP